MIGRKQISISSKGYLENTIEDISNYNNVSGVWACYGIERKGASKKRVCLNVGESNDIGREISVDKKYSEGIFNNHKGIYKNYKGETIFTYARPVNEPITTRQRVWKDIGDKYDELTFVMVSKESDKKKRQRIEMKYAEDNNALYWNPAPGQKKTMST